MLGIMIGVGAVICSVAIGEGASYQIQEQIRNIGDNMIWIEAGGRAVNGVRTGSRGMKSLTLEDVKAIRDQVPLVFNVSPHVDTAVQVVYGNQNWLTRVRGVSTEYLEVRRWRFARGSAFREEDVERAANVCLLGETVVEYLFGNPKLTIPQSVTYDQPFQRTVLTSSIPNIRDDLINGSLGVKLTVSGGPTVIANALVPLNRGGLRPNVLWTLGAEYAF